MVSLQTGVELAEPVVVTVALLPGLGSGEHGALGIQQAQTEL